VKWMRPILFLKKNWKIRITTGKISGKCSVKETKYLHSMLKSGKIAVNTMT
jgi:hypothetical protein